MTKWWSLKKKILRFSAYYSWVSLNAISLSFPPVLGQFLGAPHQSLYYGSTCEVNRIINWEWYFEGLLNTQAQYKMHIRFSKIMLNAVPEGDVQSLNCRPFCTMEWTLWHSQAITSVQAGPEELEWMHRWNPRADSALGTGSTWASMDGRTTGRSAIFFKRGLYFDPPL